MRHGSLEWAPFRSATSEPSPASTCACATRRKRTPLIREHSDCDGCLRSGRATGREKLRLHPHARRPASHHDGVATGGTPASNGAIFQLRKRQRPVTDPRQDLRVPHQGNGRAVPVVPERPAAPLVELKAQPAGHVPTVRTRTLPGVGERGARDESAGDASREENERASVHRHNVGGHGWFVYAADGPG